MLVEDGLALVDAWDALAATDEELDGTMVAPLFMDVVLERSSYGRALLAPPWFWRHAIRPCTLGGSKAALRLQSGLGCDQRRARRR